MTSNTTISSCTGLPPSVVVPWAGERVNAVNPPKRSVKCWRTSAYFSAPNDWPLLSWRGRSISTRCIAITVAQNRSIPNMKSSATVTAAEISNDPMQPNRFEKKKNMV